MATKLKNLRLSSVDLVRRGANQEADICLYKGMTPPEPTEQPTEHETNIFKRFINWLRENPSEAENEPDTIEKDYKSFETLNEDRDKQEKLWNYTSALTESIRTIVNDGDLDSSQKLEYMKKSLSQFDNAMTTLFESICTMEPAKHTTRDAVEKSDPNRFDVIEEVKKINPYHGKDGRFTSASGGGATSFTIATSDPNKQHLADRAMMSEANRTASIAVNGPSETKAFVDDYIKKHPEIEAEAKKYKDVLDNVQNFQKNNPNAEEGTYSAVTGELVNPSSGYAVTFHQNKTADNPYGAYDSDTYAKMCAIAKKETGSNDVYIGFFGNAEVSFNCSSPGKAMKFATEHNQHSIFDCSKFETVENKKYNPKTNPIEGY